MPLKMLLSAPRILSNIKEEHRSVEEIIRKQNIDAVISDNRYGLWTKRVLCIFITHQLRIRSPFAEGGLQKINYRFIAKYNECWVPDLVGKENLSGELSHGFPLPPNTHYIGPLSRFEQSGKTTRRYDVMAVLSGPEPQRRAHGVSRAPTRRYPPPGRHPAPLRDTRAFGRGRPDAPWNRKDEPGRSR